MRGTYSGNGACVLGGRSGFDVSSCRLHFTLHQPTKHLMVDAGAWVWRGKNLLATLLGNTMAQDGTCQTNGFYRIGFQVIFIWENIYLYLIIIRLLTSSLFGFFCTTVHLGGGIWGAFAYTLVHKSKGVLYVGSNESFKWLGWTLVAVLVYTAWAGLATIALMLPLYCLGKLRYSNGKG